MPAVFPWLPIGTEVAGFPTGRVVKHGEAYQILAAGSGGRTVLLVRRESFSDPVIDTLAFPPIKYGSVSFSAQSFSAEQSPVRVSDVAARSDFRSAGQLLDLAKALRELGTRVPQARWADALYLPSHSVCLAVSCGHDDRHLLAVQVLTGGVSDKSLSAAQVRQYNPWLTVNDVVDFFNTIGIALEARQRPSVIEETQFSLPGRPELESFFREYVIDFFARRPEYEAMGIRPPNGVILYGPPGSGKTHAVRALAKHLGWSIFEVGMGSVGSPYIHQTSVTLKRLFDEAAAKSPALILMDEVDVLMGQRSMGAHEHKIEEVGELLKLVETAGARGVLVIATTNRIEAIDPAMLRKGRFDHQIEVGHPNRDEISAALAALLAVRPTAPGLEIDAVAVRLDGRPMSDVAWVVDDAARLAVKSGKPAVDAQCMSVAVDRLLSA